MVRPRVILAMSPTSTWLPPPVNLPVPGAHASGMVTVIAEVCPAPSPEGHGVTAVADTATEAPPGEGKDPARTFPVASTKAPVNTTTLLKLTAMCGLVPSAPVDHDVTLKLIVGVAPAHRPRQPASANAPTRSSHQQL